MKLPRRLFLHLAAGAAALSTVSRIAGAQTYPARPVRIVVGFGGCCVEHPVNRMANIKVAQIVRDDLTLPLATMASSKGLFFIADLPSS